MPPLWEGIVSIAFLDPLKLLERKGMEIWRLLSVSRKAEKLLTYRFLWCLLDHPNTHFISFVQKALFISTHRRYFIICCNRLCIT